MTREQYERLLPHKTFIDAIYECIQKGTQPPDLSRDVSMDMIQIKDAISGGVKTDTSCGNCVRSAVYFTVKRFKLYENTFSK